MILFGESKQLMRNGAVNGFASYQIGGITGAGKSCNMNVKKQNPRKLLDSQESYS